MFNTFRKHFIFTYQLFSILKLLICMGKKLKSMNESNLRKKKSLVPTRSSKRNTISNLVEFFRLEKLTQTHIQILNHQFVNKKKKHQNCNVYQDIMFQPNLNL